MVIFKAAILTISDTASKDAIADSSGPTINRILQEHGSFVVERTAIVPDDIDIIRQTISSWASGPNAVDFLVTTGGTGFGVRDKTPEAVEQLLERKASGLVHLILSSSLSHTSMAALSRPVAGTVKGTLVVTLPGSVKAVSENMESLLTGGVLLHALDLTSGGSGRTVHDSLIPAGRSTASLPLNQVSHRSPHHHHQHHHQHEVPVPRTTLSHDPSAPVSQRHRVSPYAIISFSEAIERIFARIHALDIVKKPVNPSLSGSVLASNIVSTRDIPSSYTTSVDGYALKDADKPAKYKVLTPRTHQLSEPWPEGAVYRINTGAPLPLGTNAVIMVEDTILTATHSADDGEEEELEIETLVPVPTGENVRNPGSDVKTGECVLHRGTVIGSGGGEIGTLAFVGCREVEVFRKPRVAVLSTGDELIDLHSDGSSNGLHFSGIYDTNRPSLIALLQGLGYEVVDLGIVPDTLSAHIEVMRRGLVSADLLLTTGGSSMGSTDLLKPIIERHLDGTIHFGRVSVKPGKPTTFATVTVENVSKPVFALPGNPASALVTFYLFVLPALRIMGGWRRENCQLPRIPVFVQEDMPLDARAHFHRVIIRREGVDFVAYSTGGQRSSRVASLSGANGLVHLPPQAEADVSTIKKGTQAEAVLIGELLSTI